MLPNYVEFSTELYWRPDEPTVTVRAWLEPPDRSVGEIYPTVDIEVRETLDPPLDSEEIDRLCALALDLEPS